MRNKIVIGAAGVGLLAAGLVSAANLETSAVDDSTLAAGDVTVSGATLTDVEFQLDATKAKLDKMTMTFTDPGGAALNGAKVVAKVGDATSGSATTNSQGVAVVDISPDVLVEDVTSISVVVAS